MTGTSRHEDGLQARAYSAQTSGGRSTIAFAYAALDDAIRVAAAIHGDHESSCDLDQLAAGLETTTSSSTFRSLVASARTFGLIHRRSKVVTLTELGAAIVDPLTCDEAKIRAFLEVPLYRKLFDKFAGVLLPADTGLEAEIEALGVTPKSVAKARQTLMRSAAVAGFFNAGKDRLVRPPSGRTEDTSTREDAATAVQEARTPDASAVHSAVDPLLHAIWARLPVERTFPSPERGQWLKMLELALDMVYGSAADKASSDAEEAEPF